MAQEEHRLIVAVQTLIKEVKDNIVASAGNPNEYTEEQLLARALEAKRREGWCDVSTLQLGKNGDQRWAIIFHSHRHRD